MNPLKVITAHHVFFLSKLFTIRMQKNFTLENCGLYIDIYQIFFIETLNTDHYQYQKKKKNEHIFFICPDVSF